MFQRLAIICALFAVVLVGQKAHAVRFGLNTGFYNESINSGCEHSREFGLRLGAYIDPSPSKSCVGDPCSPPVQAAQMPCGCGAALKPMLPPPCHTAMSYPCGQSEPTQVQNLQPRTEVYLLVLPPQQYPNSAYYPPQQPAPQYYQENIPENQPVRGYW